MILMLVTILLAPQANFGVCWGGSSTNRCIEGGAASALLISRHHLEVSYCRAGAGQGICNTKKRRADPSLGTAHYSNPTSPPIHSFPLLSTCCLILTVLIFSLSLWEQSVLDSVNVSREKRCRKGENYHMSLSLHFTLGASVLDSFHVSCEKRCQ